MSRCRSIADKMLRGALGMALSMLLAPHAARACRCQTSYAPCNEAGVSDAVFVGTVESISPVFLSRWNATSQASLQALNTAFAEAQEHSSAASLDRLKAVYLESFPDLPSEARQGLQKAKTIFDITSVFYSTLNGGMKVRFKLRTLYKHEADDDDAPKAKDDAGDEDSLEISTPFGDCGVAFQTGDTYLVYADNDENSGLLNTTVCTRTRRLTDAGEDLAYLFYYKEQHDESTRLEGFTTTNAGYQLDLDKMHDPTVVKPAVPGLVVQLRSGGLTRYANSDEKGRFVFDGLAAGEYSLSAFDRDYPAKQNLLAGPRTFSLEAKSCALQVLVVPVVAGQPK